MNERFTEEQIKAYAAQFREGDAIWRDGEWRKVLESVWGLSCESPNRYVIHCYDGEVAIDGFKEHEDTAYRVTTLEHYELQGGEKIVWLGKSDGFVTFGKSYEVDERIRYRRDDGISVFILSNYWGVIPRYEQVKKRNVTDEEFDNLLNEIDKTLEPIKNSNQLSHVVQYPTAADREEEVLKLKVLELFLEDMSDDDVIDDLKDIAIVQIRKNNYDKAVEAINAIKEWEEKK